MTLPDKGDPGSLVKRLRGARMNVLRMAVYQATGDEALRDMRVVSVPVRGGASYSSELAPEECPIVLEKAVKYLTSSSWQADAASPPSDEALSDMMRMFGADRVDRISTRFGAEELAFDEFPREVRWESSRGEGRAHDYHVTIVGAGVTGLAAAVQLQRLGIPYTVLERNTGIGGTWYVNDYPLARVDVNSFAYQFKFEKHYPWSGNFATQTEQRAYLEHIADAYEVKPHIQFGVELISGTWDESASLWHVSTESKSDGTIERFSTNFVLSAAGLFNKPGLPNIRGLDTFAGPAFHTSQWPHDFDFSQKRIGLLGVGSSGAQVTPWLAENAAKLVVFQRTPQWVAPQEGYRDPLDADARWLIQHVPFYWNWYCYSAFLTSTRGELCQAYDCDWQSKGGLVSEENDALRATLTEYISKKLGQDPTLLKKCLPAYPPWARRLVVDGGWYDALLRDNVELVTDSIVEISGTHIVTTEAEHEVDAIVAATGFEVSQYLWPARYVGNGGRSLQEVWRDGGPRAYLGISIPEFPNLFVLWGPNALPRSGSIYSWAELWVRYSLSLVVHVIENDARSIECLPDAYVQYNAEIEERMPSLVPCNEGAGYYRDAKSSRHTLFAPWSVYEYYEKLSNPVFSNFHLS